MIGRPLVLVAAGLLVAGAAVWTLRDDPAASQGVAPAMGGASLFQAKGCAGCHQGPGIESQVDVGPPLEDAASWAGTRIPGTPAAAYLRQSIVDPQAFISPAANTPLQMPTLPLSADELDAVVAFLLEAPAS